MGCAVVCSLSLRKRFLESFQREVFASWIVISRGISATWFPPSRYAEVSHFLATPLFSPRALVHCSWTICLVSPFPERAELVVQSFINCLPHSPVGDTKYATLSFELFSYGRRRDRLPARAESSRRGAVVLPSLFPRTFLWPQFRTRESAYRLLPWLLLKL